ncbi:MAG: FG-GAP-like repeat-containing protein [Bacteroidia bacterium]
MKGSIVFPILIFSFFANAQTPSWFSDITPETGLTGQKMQKAYAADVNNDGFIDLITITGIDYFNNRKPLKLFINETDAKTGLRKFTDKTDWSKINSNVNETDTGKQVTCAAFADVDNDGDVDMVTAHYFHRIENYKDVGDRCQVMLNNGQGQFTIKPNNGLDELGLTNTQGLSFLDYDLDGNIDLFIGNWFSDYTKDKVQDDILMKGNGNGTFTNVTAFTNLNKPTNEPLYGSSAGDWNNDGWDDIFTASYCRTGGSLWKNAMDGKFENVAKKAGYTSHLMKGDNGQELCHWAAMPCDYDNDGDFDFYFAMVHGGNDVNEGRSTIVKNQGPDSSYQLRWFMDITPKAAPYASHSATYDAGWFDFDNDGLTDLCYADGTYVGGGNGRLFMFRQNANNKFSDVTKALNLTLNSNKYITMNIVRPMDYDNDGDEDLLIYGGGSPGVGVVPIFLKNNAGNNKNHVVINLKPAFGTNGSCVGAIVKVYCGKLIKTREVYAGQGNAAGQAPFSLVFGLDNNSIIDSVVVIFPNKKHRRIVKTNLNVNQTYTIYEYIHGLQDESITVFPNPAKGEVNVAFPSSYTGSMNLSVFDLTGKLVLNKRFEVGYGFEKVDISSLASGYYIVQLQSGNGKVSRQKLLVE